MNQERERDPEIHQAKNGNPHHFDTKAHIGVDPGYTGANRCTEHLGR